MSTEASENHHLISNLFQEKVIVDHNADIIAELCDIGRDYGIEHFTYFRADRTDSGEVETVIKTSYPASWFERYNERDYHRIDPVVQNGLRNFLPVDWSTIDKKEKRIQDFFGEASEHGIRDNGITIPIRDERNITALFSINMEAREKSWHLFKKEFLSEIIYLAFLSHQQVRRGQASDCAVSPLKLSNRETEVLQWAAAGKTAWETARILQLSQDTVAFYLKNAIAKLGVANKTQAVAIALAHGAIVAGINTPIIGR
ncbi:LuxR family transcriptional regulator [Actibacterium ureilyticum]|uniref:LuxR family transcriptional regulator n=1 Tax=Actibacterium ureilyticum TaxID=1590614 RepID=UPI000BAAFFC9|nr:LuxR family transcriptional regulator [Actibacterium ureilyticum]